MDRPKKALRPRQKSSARGVQLTEPRKGRSTYTEAVGLEICEWIASGKSLRAYCKRRGAPSHMSVYRWLLQNVEFRERYIYARQLQAETFVDEIVEISDNSSPDPVVVQRDRLRVDTRKWAASKQNSGKYGERAELNVNAEHHHVHESVSATDEWLTKLLTGSADSPPKKFVPN